jgi:hypothetical protein
MDAVVRRIGASAREEMEVACRSIDARFEAIQRVVAVDGRLAHSGVMSARGPRALARPPAPGQQELRRRATGFGKSGTAARGRQHQPLAARKAAVLRGNWAQRPDCWTRRT